MISNKEKRYFHFLIPYLPYLHLEGEKINVVHAEVNIARKVSCDFLRGHSMKTFNFKK